MAETACGVILAAGAGRRFGGGKLVADVDGKPLLQWAIDAACRSSCLDRVVVVLGADAAAISARISFGRAETVLCERWIEGQAASLRCGVDAARPADWFAILLGDMPLVTSEIIERLMEVTRSAQPVPAASRAVWHGRPGHPVLLSSTLAPRLMQLRGDVGARSVLAGVDVLEIECGSGSYADIDTEADLQR